MEPHFRGGRLLHADIGRAKAIELPPEETERRWHMTTPQWPVMHAVMYGVTRDQLMAKHKANHIQVAYGPDAEGANRALAVKAAMFREMGIAVNVCGTGHGSSRGPFGTAFVQIARCQPPEKRERSRVSRKSRSSRATYGCRRQ